MSMKHDRAGKAMAHAVSTSYHKIQKICRWKMFRLAHLAYSNDSHVCIHTMPVVIDEDHKLIVLITIYNCK